MVNILESSGGGSYRKREGSLLDIVILNEQIKGCLLAISIESL
jgi:hypothetical protein